MDEFTEAERTIRVDGSPVILSKGSEAPWLSPLGACLVKVYDFRRREDGKVEFGVGNETPPILGWVTAEEFFDEWPQ
jgi:hypothetical protein